MRQLADLQAKCARLGFDLQPLCGTAVIVQRWGLYRVLDDLAMAQRWYDEVRGRQVSIRVMTLVWERSKHAGTELLMLLALADHSDDQGNSYPAVPSLAAKCRMTARNAGYILKNLQASGELEVRPNEGPRGTNRYRIVLERLAPLKAASGVDGAKGMKPASGVGVKPTAGVKPLSPLKPASGTPEMQRRLPLKPTSDETSLNRQEPSSKARRVRSTPAATVDFNLPNWIPADTWSDFVSMRRSIRKPMTSAAMALQVKALEKLRADGHDPRAVLEQSIAASWQGLFPIKAETRGGRAPVLAADEIFEAAR